MKQLVKEEGVKNKNSLKNENVSQEIRDTLIYRFADLFELYNFIKQKLFRQYSQMKWTFLMYYDFMIFKIQSVP